jgi:hypothetical protein
MRMLSVVGFLVISIPKGFFMMPRSVMAKAFESPAMMEALACDVWGALHISSLVLQAVADVDQSSGNVILMLQALERGELGVVIQNSEDILLAIIAGCGIGASKIRVKEFQDPGRSWVEAGGGGGSLCICYNTGLTEPVGVLLGVLNL